MSNDWIETIKEIDIDEEVKIDEENSSKIAGISEHFKNRLIILYDGINYFNKDDEHAPKLSEGARKCDGYEDCECGKLIFEDKIILVYDKNKMIEKMIEEYKSDGEEEDPDYSFWTMAIENYEYNIVGAYMDGVPAFANLDSECLS